jgi:hypothetical protein
MLNLALEKKISSHLWVSIIGGLSLFPRLSHSTVTILPTVYVIYFLTDYANFLQ